MNNFRIKQQKYNRLCCLLLLLLTVFSVVLGQYAHFNSMANMTIFVVMLLVCIKGQQIIDVFMELKHAPLIWRYLLIAYVFTIPMLIFIILIF